MWQSAQWRAVCTKISEVNLSAINADRLTSAIFVYYDGN